MNDPICADSTTMTGGASATARNRVAPNVVVENPDAVQHASCGVMRVTYWPRVPEHHRFKTFGEIHLFIPGNGGSLRVTREAEECRAVITLLLGHQILIVPAGRLHALHCERQSELIVIMLHQTHFELQ